MAGSEGQWLVMRRADERAAACQRIQEVACELHASSERMALCTGL